MKNSKKQGPTQWFIFFKDQLLLKKEKTEKGEIKYSVPYGTEPPLAPGSGSTIHEVFLPTDEMVLWTNIKLPEKHIRYCIGISIAVFVPRVVCLRNIRPLS